MLEMLLVPLLALGLLAVPVLGDDDDDVAVTDDPAPDPETPTQMPDPADTPDTPDTPETPDTTDPDARSPADAVTRVTGGETFTGALAGVTETDDPAVFDVTGTDGDDAVQVGESDARFNVAPGDGADTVTVGLNSNVSMGAPVFGIATEITPPEGDGVPSVVTEQVDTADTDADEIILNITEAGIASLPEGVAFGSRIDLSDADDALMIELPDEVAGNLHLIEVEEDTGGEAANTVSRYTLVILSSPEVTELTDAQALAIAQGESSDLEISRLAIVEQGSLQNTLSEDRLDQQNDLNDEPMIAANRDIVSEASVVL